MYDPETRRFVRQEPKTYDGDGRPIEDNPAYVVREIFERIAAGDSVTRIRRSLQTRGIPTPRGAGNWTNFTVNFVARNPTYIGQRVYQAASTRPADRHAAVLAGVETQWQALVSEEVFWAVQRIFADPARQKYRPTRAVHLLSTIARCAHCGGAMVCHTQNKNGRKHQHYECKDWAETGIKKSTLEDFVEEVMKRWLSDPDVYAALTSGDDSEVAAQARADIERLTHQLEECRVNGEDPDADAVYWERRARSLAVNLREAQKLAQSTTLPPVLAGNIGPEAAGRWDSLDLAIRRQIIKATADIRVKKSPYGRGLRVPVADRIEWRWLIGPDSGDDAELIPKPTEEQASAARDAKQGDRRTKALDQRLEGRTREEIASGLGISAWTVNHDLTEMGYGPVRQASRRDAIEAALRGPPGDPRPDHRWRPRHRGPSPDPCRPARAGGARRDPGRPAGRQGQAGHPLASARQRRSRGRRRCGRRPDLTSHARHAAPSSGQRQTSP